MIQNSSKRDKSFFCIINHKYKFFFENIKKLGSIQLDYYSAESLIGQQSILQMEP